MTSAANCTIQKHGKSHTQHFTNFRKPEHKSTNMGTTKKLKPKQRIKSKPMTIDPKLLVEGITLVEDNTY